MRLSMLLATLVLLLTACPSDGGKEPVSTPATSAPPTSESHTATSPAPARPSSSGEGPTEMPRPGDPAVGTAVNAVRHLAGVIGPRHGTSPAFERAARWAGMRLRGLGYDVRRQRFAVPGGVSWGVPVPPGRSVNVVASPTGFDAGRAHVVVGAHLDTVPQAPGAEDNASGVGVLLAVAEAVAGARTRLPVVFVAFGAEEPRGSTDDDHHYGSRHYVGVLTPSQRDQVRGMVSLDRVGVGQVLPVCGATTGPDPLESAVLRAARRAGVAATPCGVNRSSDHWSFVRAGLPGVRLGSTPYAGYHSPADVPRVVNRGQLSRAGRTVVSWLSGR